MAARAHATPQRGQATDAPPPQRSVLVAVVEAHLPQNWHQTGTSQLQKAKKSAGANLLTLAFLGPSTWARIRDLRIGSPHFRYSLTSKSGDYSGLLLVFMIYVGIKRLDPNADTATGLYSEYALANSLRNRP